MTIFRSSQELESGLNDLSCSPVRRGTLEWIVRRPNEGTRDVLDDAELSVTEGLVGDSWCTRPSRHTPDGSPHPDMQLNLMNSRAIALIAGEQSRWALAGDQLYVDFDLSASNAPPGTRLIIGETMIEITDRPHRGCKKFADRFGLDAMKFVNGPDGIVLNLRGVNARVVTPGRIRRGDSVSKAEVTCKV